MIAGWFGKCRRINNAFLQAMLDNDLTAMNTYMNKVTSEMFSYFDTGSTPSGEGAERFYHGFMLGLVVELADRYVITSNRESGYGRYDVMLEPRNVVSGQEDPAIILEFKVQDSKEKNLSNTVQNALRQITEKNYQANLAAKGIPEKCIRKYGVAFCGKNVLIGNTEE